MNCKTCTFFEKWERHPARGNCHRYPPQMAVYTDSDERVESSASWPQVEVNDWCGEHKPLDKPLSHS